MQVLIVKMVKKMMMNCHVRVSTSTSVRVKVRV